MLLDVKTWTAFDALNGYTLICSATWASQVNLIPIYHLGPHRIKGIIIQNGSSRPENSYADQLHGVSPAEFLHDFAINDLGLPADRVVHFYGNADRISDQWEESAKKASEWGMPVLFNLTGGTAQMSVATVRALDAHKVRYVLLSLDKSPSQVRLTALIGNKVGDKVIPPAERKERVPSVILLASKGLKTLSNAQKRRAQEFSNARDEYARQIWKTYWKDPKSGRKALQRLGQACAKKDSLNVNALSPDVRDSIESLFATGSPDWGGGQLGKAALGFLNGGWLEQYVYSRTLEALREGIEDVSIFHGIEIQVPGHGPRGEIDLLVLQGDLPHVVEVKAQLSPTTVVDGGKSDKIQNWIDRLNLLRLSLGGVPSTGWIIAPFLEFGSATAEEDFRQRVTDAQLRLYCGRDSVDRLCDDIAAMAPARGI